MVPERMAPAAVVVKAVAPDLVEVLLAYRLVGGAVAIVGTMAEGVQYPYPLVGGLRLAVEAARPWGTTCIG